MASLLFQIRGTSEIFSDFWPSWMESLVTHTFISGLSPSASGGFPSLLWIIVPVCSPASFRLCFLGWLQDICIQNFRTFIGIYSRLNPGNFPTLAPKAAFMLHSWQIVVVVFNYMLLLFIYSFIKGTLVIVTKTRRPPHLQHLALRVRGLLCLPKPNSKLCGSNILVQAWLWSHRVEFDPRKITLLMRL